MRLGTCAALVCGWTLLATPVAAQSTTEDGIRAVLRGDYHTAARILRPLANDAAKPDPVAQFFLAILYHSGQGVGRDEMRACGLFARAGAGVNPFGDQSTAIASFMRGQLGGEAWFCMGEESWQGGPPLSFVLGPGHRVVLADTSITVTNGDQEQRMLHLLPPGALGLPFQYTPLAVSKPIAGRVHFFQGFYWMPDTTANPASWTLGWTLSEVAGDRWIWLAGENNLLVVNGASPPASLNVSNLVRLRVNAEGEPEFTILNGASPRTEVIRWQGKR